MLPSLWFISLAFCLQALWLYPAHAGVDFSMMGSQENRYYLPFFENKQEAKDWANDLKYIKPIHRILKQRMDLLRESTATLDLSKAEDVKQASFLMGAWDNYNVAWMVMDEYRKKGIMGNVGASTYAGSVPCLK